MGSSVLLITTLDTKSEEAEFLVAKLCEHGVQAIMLDASLEHGGVILDGPAKSNAMEKAIARTSSALTKALDSGIHAVVGLGGGTGGEIILRVMRALPITFPKVLITTLPFDPRIAVADNSIILVPTLADICGLNAMLREVLENAAAMTAGLCQTRRQASSCVEQKSVGITALGATEGAIAPLVAALSARGQESTVFHANGYGGAAFARFAERGAFHSIVDLTPHELTRIMVAGAHVDMPNRFSAALDLPRVVLPGALNFVGLGQKSLVPQKYLDRAHYEHSGFFTHAKLTADEMREVATTLAKNLNANQGKAALIVPKGGFSHQDRPGGQIEDPALRAVFLETVQEELAPHVQLIVSPAHISDPEITGKILGVLDDLTPA